MRRLAIDVTTGEYALARLDATEPVPTELFHAPADSFVSVTRTPAELSIICPSEWVPSRASTDVGWRRLTVRGPLEFTLTGIIAALSSELAAAGVALFTLSTFDTDHVLVKADDVGRAIAALRDAGHEVYEPA